MFAIFDTIEEYSAKNSEITAAMAYPCGTERYSEDNPRRDVNGKYPMQILPHVEQFFAGCQIQESVEYNHEDQDETE